MWLLVKAANFHPISIVISMYCAAITSCLLCKSTGLLSLPLRHCAVWTTTASIPGLQCELTNHYKIDCDEAANRSPRQFKLGCAEIVQNDFIYRWDFVYCIYPIIYVFPRIMTWTDQRMFVGTMQTHVDPVWVRNRHPMNASITATFL